MWIFAEKIWFNRRYRIFFFLGKVCTLLTNSFSDKTVFFFQFFGFPRKVWSLVIQLTLVKYFPIIHWVNLPNFIKSRSWGCFFSFQNLFFFLEKFDTHWLTQIKKQFFFFFRHGKKTGFLLTYSFFSKNFTKLNFSREIKNTVPLI